MYAILFGDMGARLTETESETISSFNSYTFEVQAEHSMTKTIKRENFLTIIYILFNFDCKSSNNNSDLKDNKKKRTQKSTFGIKILNFTYRKECYLLFPLSSSEMGQREKRG